jgi:hypothetical protein
MTTALVPETENPLLLLRLDVHFVYLYQLYESLLFEFITLTFEVFCTSTMCP